MAVVVVVVGTVVVDVTGIFFSQIGDNFRPEQLVSTQRKPWTAPMKAQSSSFTSVILGTGPGAQFVYDTSET